MQINICEICMVKIHGSKGFNKNLFIDHNIFNFIEEWSIEDKKLAAKNLFFAVQKHLNFESFFTIEDLIQTLLLAIYESYKKNRNIKPTYVPLICLSAKSNFFKRIKSIPSSAYCPESATEMQAHKEYEMDSFLQSLDIKITLEKNLTKKEYEIFQDMLDDGMTLQEIFKKHNTTIHHVKKIRKKISQLFEHDFVR